MSVDLENVPQLSMPELPPCPIHPEGNDKPVGCIMCWQRMYWEKVEGPRYLARINAEVDQYYTRVRRYVKEQKAKTEPGLEFYCHDCEKAVVPVVDNGRRYCPWCKSGNVGDKPVSFAGKTTNLPSATTT